MHQLALGARGASAVDTAEALFFSCLTLGEVRALRRLKCYSVIIAMRPAFEPPPQFCDSCQGVVFTHDEGRMTITLIKRSVLLCGTCSRLVSVLLEDMHLQPPHRGPEQL